MSDRNLTEREAFRAARYFIEQFNEREKSEALELLIGWMAEGTCDDPLETSDPAQWDDWVKSVDRRDCAAPARRTRAGASPGRGR